jgi:hypothetical protein
MYPMLLHAFVVMSNHYSMLLTTPNGRVLAAFMNYVNSRIAREAGRLAGWRARLWARRYRSIVVLDEAAMVERLRYIMAHGAKENLVWDPEQWPGAKSLPALIRSEVLHGTVYNRTGYCRARCKGKRVKLSQFAERYEVPLAPLPCWRDVSPERYRELCRGILEDIRDETKKRFRREKIAPMGPRAVKKMDPLSRPNNPKRSPAPLCHTRSKAARDDFVHCLREFVGAYREASRRFRNGDLGVMFPAHSFPPPGAFVLPAPGAS